MELIAGQLWLQEWEDVRQVKSRFVSTAIQSGHLTIYCTVPISSLLLSTQYERVEANEEKKSHKKSICIFMTHAICLSFPMKSFWIWHCNLMTHQEQIQVLQLLRQKYSSLFFFPEKFLWDLYSVNNSVTETFPKQLLLLFAHILHWQKLCV